MRHTCLRASAVSAPRKGAYVWQKLMKSGAIVSNGTDAPVEDVDPIASYYATVSRKLKDGSVFYPDQRMSRMEALKSYTINGAHAAFEEESRGSLKAGKYADMVVLSKDIMTVPEDRDPHDEGRSTRSSGGRSLQEVAAGSSRKFSFEPLSITAVAVTRSCSAAV